MDKNFPRTQVTPYVFICISVSVTGTQNIVMCIYVRNKINDRFNEKINGETKKFKMLYYNRFRLFYRETNNRYPL